MYNVVLNIEIYTETFRKRVLHTRTSWVVNRRVKAWFFFLKNDHISMIVMMSVKEVRNFDRFEGCMQWERSRSRYWMRFAYEIANRWLNGPLSHYSCRKFGFLGSRVVLGRGEGDFYVFWGMMLKWLIFIKKIHFRKYFV